MNSNTAFSELSPLYPQLLASTIKLKAGRHIVITNNETDHTSADWREDWFRKTKLKQING